MEVNGKHAVVTGAASGIGKAIALELGRRGADVVVADVDEAGATAVASEVAALGVRSLGVACDVTDRASVETLADRAWAELGSVDVILNNAGVSGGTNLLEADAQDFRWIFEVNVVGVWTGCAVFGGRFADQGTPAWIVNTGSEHSLGYVHPGLGFYTASKHAILGLSNVLKEELPPNVGVSVLCPGLVQTGLWNAGRNRPDRFGGRAEGQDFAKQIMGEGMTLEEVGRRAVDGLEAEEFLIVTHSHSYRYARDRWDAVSGAFERQAPYREEDERYDLQNVIGKLLGGGDT